MIEILVWVLIFAIIAGVVYYVLTLMPIPDPFKRIILIVFLLIILLIMLAKLLPMLGVSFSP